MVSSKFSILAYEDLTDHRNSLRQALANTSEICFQVDPQSFERELSKKEYDIIFMNVKPTNASTFKLLQKTHSQSPYTPIIITSKSEHPELVIEAIKLGAYDFISTPFSQTRVQMVVQKAINQRKLRNEIDYLRRSQDIIYNFDNIVAESPSFQKIVAVVKKFASTDSTILLTGKTGTGKSFLSGSIHYNSPRRSNPFIKINCTNIPETLLESELFGHEKGSFPGADKQRIGRFEQADGGTIFLDEISEIPLEIQTRLLRVLKEKTFERMGGNKTIKVDVRVIVATNRKLEEQIAAGKFREDLYDRINVLPVDLPELKDRPQCIEPLSYKLLDKSCACSKKRSTASLRTRWPLSRITAGRAISGNCPIPLSGPLSWKIPISSNHTRSIFRISISPPLSPADPLNRWRPRKKSLSCGAWKKTSGSRKTRPSNWVFPHGPSITRSTSSASPTRTGEKTNKKYLSFKEYSGSSPRYPKSQRAVGEHIPGLP